MKKVLFVGNTPFSVSSYGVVMKNIIASLPDYTWHVLGRQWKDPVMGFKAEQVPYLLHPTRVGDNYAFESLLPTIAKVQPDYVITIGDINIQKFYAKKLAGKNIKWFAYMPVDSDYLGKELIDSIKIISEVGTIVAMSKFGQDILKKYGFESELVYHGVNHNVFRTMKAVDKKKVRDLQKISGKFVVFTNSNNQGRKKLINLMEAFKLANIPDKLLLLHTDLLPTKEHGGWDLLEAGRYLGIENQIMMTKGVQYDGWRMDFNDFTMAKLYNMSNVFIFNGNEGFGLPVLEAQACGIPVLAGNLTTMPELVPKENLIKVARFDLNSITRGGVIDAQHMAIELERIYKNQSKAKIIDTKGWDWKEVSKAWKKVLK